VDAGLGKATSTGTTGLIAPTKTITAELAGRRIHLGPVTVEFQCGRSRNSPGVLIK